MSLIREKATESEAVVKNITKDIQVLDLAKKNLITSMTMMKRLQMLGVYPAAFASTYLCLIICKTSQCTHTNGGTHWGEKVQRGRSDFVG